jgi:putative DNA primase/helicase
MIEAKFLSAIRDVGLSPLKDDVIGDGRLHRYRVEGDRAGSKNGWYVLYTTPVPAGSFGSWRTGETHTWQENSERIMSPEERAETHRQMMEIKAARCKIQNSLRSAAQSKSLQLLAASKPASGDHPYLVRKKIKAWGIRQLRDMLLIPARSSDGQIHTIQFIGADGSKRFLTGGRITGCYYAIGQPRDTMLVAEGYATAASLFEATGHATAVAFNAGNLEPVARALREKFPRVRIVICADDDTETPGNPGLTKAIAAARAVRGLVAKPDFGGRAS